MVGGNVVTNILHNCKGPHQLYPNCHIPPLIQGYFDAGRSQCFEFVTQMRGSHSCLTEDSCRLGCDAVLEGEWLSTFRKIVSRSSSVVIVPWWMDFGTSSHWVTFHKTRNLKYFMLCRINFDIFSASVLFCSLLKKKKNEKRMCLHTAVLSYTQRSSVTHSGPQLHIVNIRLVFCS